MNGDLKYYQGLYFLCLTEIWLQNGYTNHIEMTASCLEVEINKVHQMAMQCVSKMDEVCCLWSMTVPRLAVNYFSATEISSRSAHLHTALCMRLGPEGNQWPSLCESSHKSQGTCYSWKTIMLLFNLTMTLLTLCVMILEIRNSSFSMIKLLDLGFTNDLKI